MAKKIKTNPAGASEGSNEELMSLAEAVKFLGISKPTLYRMLERGDVKGSKVGNQWRFRKADLTAYLNRDSLAVATAGVQHDVLDEELAFFFRNIDTPIPAINEEEDSREQKTIALTNSIIGYAISMRASDIHLEPIRSENKTESLLRYRVDGVLHEIRRLPIEIYGAVVQRIKIMSAMNQDEKKLPQDGRIIVNFKGRDLDLRVNMTPMVFGESVVMRILDQSHVLLSLDKVSISNSDLTRIRESIHRPNGMVFCTGPTGSGKTTTLYSCLMDIAGPEMKLMTIEDPVEYLLPNATQSQVNMRVGYTFSSALRSFLRQDPDVILVGEMRDRETLEISIQAAITGHLVFSTLHTNSAVDSLMRMLDMGIEPFLISASTNCIINQRLVRRLCENCKQPINKADEQLHTLGINDSSLLNAIYYHPVGCPECAQRGFRGRIAIHEVLIMTEHLGELINKRASKEEMQKAAIAGGMTTMLQDGLQKAAEGRTSIEEVLRVLR
ncbi:MAG: GspE/PulE family protein [bacterium]